MPHGKATDPKTKALRQQGCLNPHPERVQDPLFASSDFFDACDLVQVKYEMVRRVSVDSMPVSHSAQAFGFSRPAFYQARRRLEQGGLAALVPDKPGPRRAHKLSQEVMDFLQQLLSEDPSLRSAQLATRVQERFNLTVHPRSIERALARRKKKRQKPPPKQAP